MIRPKKKIILSTEHALKVLNLLGIDMGFDNQFRGPCPVHSGDNPTAFTLDLEKQSWVCWSQSCQQKCGSDIVGLWAAINGVSRKQAIEDIKGNNVTIEEIEQSEQDLFIEGIINKKTDFPISNMDPIPVSQLSGEVSDYFLDAGLSRETLDTFGIRYCNTPGKPMYQRHFAPILNLQGTHIIGVTGRSKWPQCHFCDEYHDPKKICPKDLNYSSPKWKHFGVYTQNYFYNIGRAKDLIQETGTVIIFEGPKPVWKFHQWGIENCIAVLGSFLSARHRDILLQNKARRIILAFDNDSVGRTKWKNVYNFVKDYFTISDLYDVIPEGKDPFDIEDRDKLMKYL